MLLRRRRLRALGETRGVGAAHGTALGVAALTLALALQTASSFRLENLGVHADGAEKRDERDVVEISRRRGDVLGRDVVHAHVLRLLQRRLEHALRTTGKRNLGGSPSSSVSGVGGVVRRNLPRFLARALDGHPAAEVPPLLRLLGDEAHQDVLGANLRAFQSLGLLLREHHSLDGALGELLKHRGDHQRAASLRKRKETKRKVR